VRTVHGNLQIWTATTVGGVATRVTLNGNRAYESTTQAGWFVLTEADLGPNVLPRRVLLQSNLPDCFAFRVVEVLTSTQVSVGEPFGNCEATPVTSNLTDDEWIIALPAHGGPK
jgi:hypothetical protein